MKHIIILTVLLSYLKLCILYSFIGNHNFLKYERHINKRLSRLETFTLLAKKKSKLISDDFLNTLENTESEKESKLEAEITDPSTLAEPKAKKVKKKEKHLVKEGLLDSLKEGNEIAYAESIEDTITKEEIPITDETIEQKFRRERPPARVKFAESSQPGFAMLALENVGLVIGNTEIILDSTFSVSTNERVGLVGPNGSGKTTQLKILAGDIIPTTGTVVKSSPNLRVSFLRQEFLDSLNLKNTLRQELYVTFAEELSIIEGINNCEKEITESVDNEAKMNETLDKLQALQEKAISKGVYSLNSKVEKMMDNMGFSKADADSLISTFSGGWKMRIGLAKILLENPNIVLLDEPTNHLDLDSVFWLEDFLIKQTIPMVVVSHDREFLDRVCNKIVDTEEGKSVSYTGNYSKFIEQRAIRLALWRDKYEKQMKYVKEEESLIKKAKSDPSQANVMNAKLTALDKFKSSDEYLKPPPKDKKFRFRFPVSPRCSQNMVEVHSVVYGYDKDNILFENVSMTIDRGDRIGFVGANGAGKSTLMRIIHGTVEPRMGFVEFASNNVMVNYFEQSTADSLDLNLTIFETIQEVSPSDFSMTEIRGLLGQFMFKGDDADKKLSSLSGGEKGRVALCRMILQPSNLLLLDEPTNHLDISSKEVLEEALLHYEGAVVVISHDRYFMSQIAKQIYSFEQGKVTRHDCDYLDFINGKSDGLKEKIESRYIDGDTFGRITNAKDVLVEEVVGKSKRNFGGSGVTSGNLFKGIKNAKRYSNQ